MTNVGVGILINGESHLKNGRETLVIQLVLNGITFTIELLKALYLYILAVHNFRLYIHY
jgi:hypothetical protein